MEIVISDSSTLILLTKSKLINNIIQHFELIIPSIVYAETQKGKEKGYIDAYVVEDLVNIGKIKIKEPSKETILQISNQFKLVKGELYAVALCLENKNRVIFMDDKKGIRICNLLGIEVYTALSLLKIFFQSKLITKQNAEEYFYFLKKFGRYTDYELNETKKVWEAQ
jgi:predicted nucleic acid-binding protein